MTATVRCADADVISGRVTLGLDGAWVAWLRLDRTTAPTGSVTIEADGGFTLTGTVAVSGVQSDVAYVRIVGGAGGLGVDVSGFYRSAKMRDVLRAIAAQSGESLDADISDDVLGIDLSLYTLGKCSAARALTQAADVASEVLGERVRWRVTDAGEIWMGAETWPDATLPAGASVIDSNPTDRTYTIGAQTPALLPGVNLSGVGNVASVEHYIEPDSIRTIASLTDRADAHRRTTRTALGIDPDAHLPAIDRLALYRAEVKACASDGSTVDVAPIDPRVPPMQGIPLRSPFPAAYVVATSYVPVCLVGWEGGDPSKPYALPHWTANGPASKVVIPVDGTMFLGAETGAQFVALANLVLSELQSIATALSSHTHTGVTVGLGVTGSSNSTYSASSVAAAKVKAK